MTHDWRTEPVDEVRPRTGVPHKSVLILQSLLTHCCHHPHISSPQEASRMNTTTTFPDPDGNYGQLIECNPVAQS